ncbi:MAG: DNA-3-methyladenine glycosylase I [Ignavibacteriaceae bacterium]
MKEKIRCPWVDLTKPDYTDYHDREWGLPIYDDRTIFEFLTLESAQAGLSWYTVLRKRANYRKAFANFEAKKVAKFSAEKVEKLLEDPGIIRNRLKISSAVTNAKLFLEIAKEFGSFSDYIWNFVNNKPIVNILRTISDYKATSPESDKLSADMKKRGFKFLGSTVCYAHMQATGLVNDHSIDCFRRDEIIKSYSK